MLEHQVLILSNCCEINPCKIVLLVLSVKMMSSCLKTLLGGVYSICFKLAVKPVRFH